HITAQDFRAFTFANAVKLLGTQNKHFFEGTRVTKGAAAGHATPKSGIVNRTGTIAHLPHAMSLLDSHITQRLCVNQ
ncbi:MAG: hypothetical protein WA633_13970, partial [Stellaceae bacterium]